MNTYNCDSNIPYIEIQCERQLNIKQVAFFVVVTTNTG